MQPSPARPRTRAVLADGGLLVRADPSLLHLLVPWLPDRRPVRTRAAQPLRIRVRAGAPARPPAAASDFEMLGLHGYVDAARRRVRLCGDGGWAGGSIALDAGRALLRVRDPGVPGEAGRAEVLAALTVVSALLLGARGAALVHAAGVVGADGRCWLLLGDSHSGKTSTCVNLIRAGWDWLADDHVVLRSGADGGIQVEGWPRRFNLDAGFMAGTSRGTRLAVDPRTLGPGRPRVTAPLGGVLRPRVRPGEPTRYRVAHPADTLAALIRQSPWVLVDPAAAAHGLELLTRVARSPAAELELGMDSYRDPRFLHERVEAAIGAARGAASGAPAPGSWA